MTRIEVTVREVYGKPLYYPANEAAKTLALLTKTKTLSYLDLQLARKLGMGVLVSAHMAVPTEAFA